MEINSWEIFFYSTNNVCFLKNIQNILENILCVWFNSNILFCYSASVHDDSEDKNLSWLYNYKLNELPHLSPEVNRSRTETGLQVDKLIQEVTASETEDFNQIANDTISSENPAKL